MRAVLRCILSQGLKYCAENRDPRDNKHIQEAAYETKIQFSPSFTSTIKITRNEVEVFENFF